MSLEIWQTVALACGGVIAGIVNTMAGGGSLLTVPLLVMIGLPGTLANGTNRLGVLVQSLVASWRFRAEGVSGFRSARPIVIPLLAGSWIGAVAISRVAPETFERLFGLAMLALLAPVLRVRPESDQAKNFAGRSALTVMAVFFVIGLYGGAFQAGVGVLLVLALARVGHDLVLSNSIKVVLVAALAAIASVVFIRAGQVVWLPAGVLAVSTSVGAVIGARIAVRGGESVIRPLLAVAIVAMAGRMLGLY